MGSIVVTCTYTNTPAILYVPQPYNACIISRRQRGSIRRHVQRTGQLLMLQEHLLRPAQLRHTHADAAVLRAHHEQLAGGGVHVKV